MAEHPTSTRRKALALNLDRAKYGTIAEIGAGQEVARWFFVVGGAAGTVAKTISAYDMEVSDSIYGPAPRYVSRQRLQAMLENEFSQLLEGLGSTRGETTSFFAFADTVATRSYRKAEDGRGWMGIRFQGQPRETPSDVVLHVNLKDNSAALQQEALGVVGINLIYGAYHYHDEPETLIGSLMDELSRDRVEVDMIKFSGPAFDAVDNRLMSLQLVEQGLTDAAMFTATGEVVQPSEVLHKKPILVERGTFRPVTKLTLDLLAGAREQFVAEPAVQGEEPVVLMEMTCATSPRAHAWTTPISSPVRTSWAASATTCSFRASGTTTTWWTTSPAIRIVSSASRRECRVSWSWPTIATTVTSAGGCSSPRAASSSGPSRCTSTRCGTRTRGR